MAQLCNKRIRVQSGRSQWAKVDAPGNVDGLELKQTVMDDSGRFLAKLDGPEPKWTVICMKVDGPW